ncbi:MAG: NifB/NifX family molybdenum-iron cluster-binding protein [Candidatus Omnitrophica bacterium]|nr:NifB/NifX family molybdenum-iron cluster-binding protein [Candidatus Omnitrophota bacterium]MCM8802754.1 NifB/NifX family molybdenum-iron cluster-binding protein [Candidatus Omnitrophota bacterium]
MKIAIASDDGKTISSHFGRTKGFVIFEVEGKEIKGQKYLLNTFTGHARGLEDTGHEIDRHTPILNALKDCKAVISHGMGMRIYNDLKEAGIEVFVTEETDVKNAFDLYLSGGLIDKPEIGCPHKDK